MTSKLESCSLVDSRIGNWKNEAYPDTKRAQPCYPMLTNATYLIYSLAVYGCSNAFDILLRAWVVTTFSCKYDK